MRLDNNIAQNNPSKSKTNPNTLKLHKIASEESNRCNTNYISTILKR